MITANRGSVQIEGDGLTILAEATSVLLGVYDALEKRSGELFAIAGIESVVHAFKTELVERIGEDDVVTNETEDDILWWD